MRTRRLLVVVFCVGIGVERTNGRGDFGDITEVAIRELHVDRPPSDQFVKTIRRATDYAPSRDGCVAPDPPSFHASAENHCENIPQNPDIPRGGRADDGKVGNVGKDGNVSPRPTQQDGKTFGGGATEMPWSIRL